MTDAILSLFALAVLVGLVVRLAGGWDHFAEAVEWSFHAGRGPGAEEAARVKGPAPGDAARRPVVSGAGPGCSGT